MNIFETKNLIKKYKSGSEYLFALNGVSVELPQGKITTILGPSGSGKTTLLNVLSGLDQVDSGEINFENKNISKLNIAKLNERELTKYRRNNTGFIFQSYNLISTLTVRENIELGEYLSKNSLDIDEVLKEVELFEHRNKFPHQLSGGQQQRVAIARVLVKNPNVIFCDEPTGALDEKSGKKVLALLQNLNEKYNTTLIMVTHNPNIANMSHKVINFKDGQIVKEHINETVKKADEIDWS